MYSPNRPIEVHKEVITRDAAFGSQQVTWVKLRSMMADVRYPIGKEVQIPASGSSQQQTGIQPVEFVVRYQADINSKRMRILFEGQTYEVIAIQEVQRRMWTKITAEQRDNI